MCIDYFQSAIRSIKAMQSGKMTGLVVHLLLKKYNYGLCNTELLTLLWNNV